MIERRYMTLADGLAIEERAAGAPVLRGRAIVYGSRSYDLGGFTEIIEPGAFDHLFTREAAPDVVALWNHDASALLGRTASGTLRLMPDAAGVGFELDPPDTTLGRDLLALCRRGDVTGCSFAFTVERGGDRLEHDDAGTTRYITRASGLFDVSLVTNPAYGATNVSVRSLASMIAEHVAPASIPLSERDRFNLARAGVWARRART